MAFSITSIPKIMRANRWDNGASLMDTWFSRAAAIAPAYSLPETTTIQIKTWALTFPRAKKVYDELMNGRVWTNLPAQKEIAKMLKTRGLLTPTSVPRPFGNLSAPTPILDADYINFRVVESGMHDLDDLTAALGNFTFRVLVVGNVVSIPKTPRFKVTITEVGVYIRDSYDFEGHQLLGFWDDATDTVSAANPFTGTEVTNGDFRDWRTKNGKGGDFLVFSDVARTILQTPDSFEV